MIMSLAEILKIVFWENMTNEFPMLTGLFGLLTLVVLQQIDDIKKTKDKYTKGHSSRVADYTREIARRFGYKENELNDIYMMGLLHDIGKIGVPDAIINKTGKLTEEEYEIMKEHRGCRRLRCNDKLPELS